MCKDKYNDIGADLNACVYIRALETLVPKQKTKMKIAPVPAYERERLKVLNDYNILDTKPEIDFDDIAGIAATVCDTPAALVSFIDAGRQWFKACYGLQAKEIIRDQVFCAHAINNPAEVFIVNDLSGDDRFFADPLLTAHPGTVFYAGAPLVTADGFTLGILSVLDTVPRELNEVQVRSLQSLARQVVALLELRKKNTQLAHKRAELDMAYSDLDNIMHLASHDLKSPLNNIISLSDLVKTEFGDILGEDGGEYISYLSEAAYYLSDMVSGILSYSRAARLSVDAKDHVDIDALMQELLAEQKVPERTTINFINNVRSINTNGEALKKILQHLLKNAVLYGDKAQNNIDITCSGSKGLYTFEIKDNGEGVSEADIPDMFVLFKRLNGHEKTAENMGIGIPVARRLVAKLGGTFTISSQQGVGTSVIFTIPE